MRRKEPDKQFSMVRRGAVPTILLLLTSEIFVVSVRNLWIGWLNGKSPNIVFWHSATCPITVVKYYAFYYMTTALFLYLFISFIIFFPDNQIRNIYLRRQKWPPCKGYTLCKIISLGQKMKLPKTYQKRIYKDIILILCKKLLEKIPNI